MRWLQDGSLTWDWVRLVEADVTMASILSKLQRLIRSLRLKFHSNQRKSSSDGASFLSSRLRRMMNCADCRCLSQCRSRWRSKDVWMICRKFNRAKVVSFLSVELSRLVPSSCTSASSLTTTGEIPGQIKINRPLLLSLPSGQKLTGT